MDRKANVYFPILSEKCIAYSKINLKGWCYSSYLLSRGMVAQNAVGMAWNERDNSICVRQLFTSTACFKFEILFKRDLMFLTHA